MARIKIMEKQMRYYINKNKEIFGYELDGSQDHLITEDMVEISLEEIEAINQAKEDEFLNSIEYKINEAKEYLVSTDHKFYNGYKPKEGEDLVEIERLRDEAREFIRLRDITKVVDSLLTVEELKGVTV